MRPDPGEGLGVGPGRTGSRSPKLDFIILFITLILVGGVSMSMAGNDLPKEKGLYAIL